MLGPRFGPIEKNLAQFNNILRRLAKKLDCRLVDVNKRMLEAVAAGQEVLDDDQLHPNFQGHRLIAQSVIDALGYDHLCVHRQLKLTVMPGVIRDWHLRAVDRQTPPLTQAAVAGLVLDSSWKDYHLPETKPIAWSWWLEMERQRGFAATLGTETDPGMRHQCLAILEASEPCEVVFTTGGYVQSVWLHGQRLYHYQVFTGWHAGKERIAASLKPGSNRLVVETCGAFFLSCTKQSH